MGLARFFTSGNTPLAQMRNNWIAVREIPGIDALAKNVQGIIAKRELDLRRDEMGLWIVAEQFEDLDAEGRESFLDDTVWQLIHSPNVAIRQKGIELALIAPQTTERLRSELQDSDYLRQYRVPAGQEQSIVNILKKPVG